MVWGKGSTKELQILYKVNNNIPIRRRNNKLFFQCRSTKEQLHIQLADKYLLAKRVTNLLIYIVIAATTYNGSNINSCNYSKKKTIILFQNQHILLSINNWHIAI